MFTTRKSNLILEVANKKSSETFAGNILQSGTCHTKMCLRAYAESESSDKPSYSRSLINNTDIEMTGKCHNHSAIYSRTSIAQTPMAHLPWLTRTRV